MLYICLYKKIVCFAKKKLIGDFAPTSISQKIFMCFGLTVGSFMTTYFISAIVHLVATQNHAQTTKKLLYNNLKLRIKVQIIFVGQNTFGI